MVFGVDANQAKKRARTRAARGGIIRSPRHDPDTAKARATKNEIQHKIWHGNASGEKFEEEAGGQGGGGGQEPRAAGAGDDGGVECCGAEGLRYHGGA